MPCGGALGALFHGRIRRDDRRGLPRSSALGAIVASGTGVAGHRVSGSLIHPSELEQKKLT